MRKMGMNRWYWSILLLLISNSLLTAQETLVVKAPKVVRMGEQFRLDYVANTRDGEFVAPEIKDLYVLSGPNPSFNSQTSIVNGKVTQSVSMIYSFYIQATRKGDFTIPPARLKLKGKEIKSNEVTIEVVEDSSPAGNPGGQTGNVPENSGETTTVSGEDLFVRILLDKTEVYQGEAVVASLKLYSRINLSGINQIKPPDFNGFYKQELETPPLRSLERENVNGQIYGTGILQRFLLFPQRSGEIEIGEAEVTGLIQQRVSSGRSNSPFSDPFFDSFFDQVKNIPKVLVSPVRKIKVKSLPTNAPAGFTGGVGQFSLEANLPEGKAKANQAVSLSLKITGTGNLDLIEAPKLKLPADFEVYDPKTEQSVSYKTSGAVGNKTFEYLMIPRHDGEYPIPAVSLVYFDPAEGRYKTLRSEGKTLNVLPGEESTSGTPAITGFSREDVRYLSEDIRYIKSRLPKLRMPKPLLIGSNTYFAILASMMATFILVILIRRERIRRNSDQARVRNRKAGKMARKRLKQASVLLHQGKQDQYYEEILQAIWRYLSDKLSIPQADLSHEKAAEMLKRNKIAETVIQKTFVLIEECEFARYAPQAEGDEARKDTFERAVEVLSELEERNGR